MSLSSVGQAFTLTDSDDTNSGGIFYGRSFWYMRIKLVLMLLTQVTQVQQDK